MMPKKNKSLDNEQLAFYISTQLNNLFPDPNPVQQPIIKKYIDASEERVFDCFSGIEKKYFNQSGVVLFDHLHSDQYCMYLYMLSNFIYNKEGDVNLATKLYLLNKALHSVDIYFTAQLPDIFLFVHPIGTILGRAKFSNFFICYQGVTVGCLNEGVFPEFAGPTILYANSSVLGDCRIGSNVCFGAGSKAVNMVVPDNKIVLSVEGKVILKENEKKYFERPPFVYGVSN